MNSFRQSLGSSLVALLGAAAVALLPSSALAGTYTSLAAFQANVRADTLLEPFNGPDSFNTLTSIAVSGNGYAYSVGSNPVFRVDRLGGTVGATLDSSSTRITFTGRAASAFAGTLRIQNQANAPLAGTLVLTTDTGASFTVTVPAGPVFFGFTAIQPFTWVDIQTSPAGGSRYEAIDDVYVGVSATAAQASDQCSDAPTITPTTAAVFPFTTVGATAETIPGVCDGAVDTGPDVWFRYVAPLHGSVVCNTCGCTFDSILRVFASCAAAPLGAQIACNDDFCLNTSGLNRASQVTFRVIAGEDYLIRISGFNGASGSGNLNFSFAPDCTADFNHSGGKEVQDIFDFLAAWFGAC